MQRFSFILILSIIFTGYLFSQVEENEIIKTDTAINIDSIVVEEPIDIPKEKDENYFYNHGLFRNYGNSNTIDECKETGIILVKLLGNQSTVGLSATLDIPISCNINIASICSGAIGGVDGGSPVLVFLGAGVGYVFVKTDYFILKSRACLGFLRDQGKDYGLIDRPGLNLLLYPLVQIFLYH